MRRQSVLLDVDGVLAGFVESALDILHDITGRRYPPSVVTHWDVFDSIQERAHQQVVYQRMKARGGCLSIPVIDGAKEGVARLREIADVTILTSPFNGSETWMHEREKWLEEHFNIDHRDVIHADKKFRVHGDIFIDDKPAHLYAWNQYWDGEELAVLWDSPRSASELVPFRRVKTWNEVIDLVRSRS